MKVYLCASYTRIYELWGYAADLEAAGHEVTSRWLTGTHDTPGREPTYAEMQRWAQEDIEDLTRSEWVIAFTEPKGSPNTRGGRHVEWGAALNSRLVRRLTIIGPIENVFYALPNIERYEQWSDLIISKVTLADRIEGPQP